MQVLDEQKRLKILGAASELFAANPFHKVILSDVAQAAGVGKGTLYTYFKNKDDLYLSVLYSGFADLVERMRDRLNQTRISPTENLETVIREMVRFAFQNPHIFELMRTIPQRSVRMEARWQNKRKELKELIESVIRRGIVEGVFSDPHPELTARFIPGLVRSILMENPQNVDARTLTRHIQRFILSGLENRNKPPPGSPGG